MERTYHSARSRFAQQVAGLSAGSEMQLSDMMFSEMFHQKIDPVKELFLALSGNRPSETTEQVVEIFCLQLNCMHYREPVHGIHVFKKLAPHDIKEL